MNHDLFKKLWAESSMTWKEKTLVASLFVLFMACGAFALTCIAVIVLGIAGK